MKLMVIALLLGSSLTATAQADSSKCACCTEDFRAFDFWLGNWEVKDSAGVLLGHNRIELAQNKCALIENWTSAKGYTGTSVSFYNTTRKQWHQSWIDVNGGSILMDGNLEDGTMVMYTEPAVNPKTKKEVVNKTSWKPLKDGRVLHVWEVSSDKGVTWVTVFRGYYSQKKN